MKKKILFLSILILFVIGSSYRFIQLNKDIKGKPIYKEIKYNESFNINGINFKLENISSINNVDEYKNSYLKTSIGLYRDGDIVQDGFNESFPENYSDLIILNITEKKGKLVGNYSAEVEGYEKDNAKFIEIQKGRRAISNEKENLILRFRLDKQIIEGIKNNKYDSKLVFPLNSNETKFNFINLEIK